MTSTSFEPMAFSSIVRALGRSPLTTELLSKLNQQQVCSLNGTSPPKGLVASALAQTEGRNLLVVCGGGSWALGSSTRGNGLADGTFYPTSEASPYEPFDPETEMTWGNAGTGGFSESRGQGQGPQPGTCRNPKTNGAIVDSSVATTSSTTSGSLQALCLTSSAGWN